MSLRYGFFDSEITGYDEEGMPIFDRAETSELYALFFSKLCSNGVLASPSNCFQVVANTGLVVTVKPGFGLVKGHFAYDDADANITLDIANSTYGRIDMIVLRLNNLNRKCEIIKKTGTPAASPVAPTLEQPASGDYYELCLAKIAVNANQSTIIQANITDTRYDVAYCGPITQLIDEVDFSVFTDQFESYFNGFKTTNQADFEAWFNDMKDQLTTDAAGNLQTQINALITQMTNELLVRSIKSYSSVTQIGLNATTCTITDIWNALPSMSEIILDTGTLTVLSIPTSPTHGTLHIVKLSAFRQSKIEFIPKISGAPYYMNLTSGNVPSGTWLQYVTRNEVVLKEEQLVTLLTTGWSAVSGGYQQTVALQGASATSNPIWALKLAGNFKTAAEKANEQLLDNVSFGTNTMTFYATAIPSANMPIRVKGV